MVPAQRWCGASETLVPCFGSVVRCFSTAPAVLPPPPASTTPCTLPRYHAAVRTLFRWVVVTIGLAALVRWLRRRGDEPSALEAQIGEEAREDPAEELRRKLAESRAPDAEPAAPPAAEASVDARRSDVHAQGRAALAEMTSSAED